MRVRSRLPRVELDTFRRIFAELGGHLRPHRTRLALSALSLLGISLLTLSRPWPLKIVFDYVILPGSRLSGESALAFLEGWDRRSVLALAAISVLALAALKGLLTYSHSVLSKIVGHRLVADIRLQLFSHIQRLPQSYHDYRETGELMTRMTGDVRLVKDLLVSTIITLGSQLLLILGMLAVMVWLDWVLALVAVGVIPFFALAAFRFSGRIKSSARRQREMYGKIVASMQESLAGITQVKGFGQEKTREHLLGKSIDRDVKANVRTTKLEADYSRIVEVINAVATCLVLWIGAIRAQAGIISPGDLLIFVSYLRGIYRPLQSVARHSTRAAKATVRGEKILELLDLEAEVHDAEDSVSARELRGDICFENVWFSYASGQPVLREFSCRIPPQKTTLLIGATGAGKSTVAKLILRLYEPDRGTLRIDGRDIAEYRIASLRKRITPLAQETFLFRASIAENIAFGKRRATPEEIEEAARLVGAHEFIQRLPEGYDTLVGEGGLTLSGGQRQRISFARAALRKSAVMIFDEPATGLDVHAERETKEVLWELRRERTLVIITHRLHYLGMADWVVFIRDGQMVEEGDPQTLFSRRGEFYTYITKGREPLGPAVRLDGLFQLGDRS
ncbi:MAG: ABC transporter ATP-binding protein [Candidatus Krumholzibacteriia bacterium]